MKFEINQLYHIYNQGNNRQKIFFERENYLFFLRKVRTQLLPYCDVIAYCLMPNHFHFMVRVNETVKTVGVAQSDADSLDAKKRSLNDSIGILLRSYTNAINKRYDRSGKLFREGTKAECLTCPDIKELSFCESTNTKLRVDLKQYYPQSCFKYIHQNPVKAGLVKKIEDWEFSSSRDYSGLRNGTLIDRSLAKKLGIYDTSH